MIPFRTINHLRLYHAQPDHPTLGHDDALSVENAGGRAIQTPVDIP
jgi:hypothetical protein